MVLLAHAAENGKLWRRIRRLLVRPRVTVRLRRTALVILDSNWRVVVANRGFFRIFQVEPEDIEGRPLDEMINLPWEITRLWETQGTMPRADAKLGNFEAELKSPTSGRFTLRFGAHCLRGAGLNLMVLAIEEIAGRNRSFPALP